MLLLALAPAAAADRSADLALNQAIRQYYSILRSEQVFDIESVRDQIVLHLPNATPKYRKSVLHVLDQGFEKKYGDRGVEFYKCLAQAMAAGGKQGIAKCYRRYKASLRKEERCIAIAEALGECRDPLALSTLVKICSDKRPDVASVAIRMCGNYPKVKVKERKATMRKLIDLYKKITSSAAGKEQDSTPMEMYLKTRPAFDATLKSLSGGEELDSAESWDTWLRENITKEWEE